MRLPSNFSRRAFITGIGGATVALPFLPSLLPRDVLVHESRRALDGGDDGTDLLVRASTEAAELLRPGGSLLLELGGDQAALLGPTLRALGYDEIEQLVDGDGDLRAISARWARR